MERTQSQDITDSSSTAGEPTVQVDIGSVRLDGSLVVPHQARGVVLFAHGSGSSWHSPRNRRVAQALQHAGLATLLIDLLTVEEERLDASTGHLRFDIGLLADRLVGATDWLRKCEATAPLPIGYFGASTGGGAALVAAARCPGVVGAVVSRGGRPDLAGSSLPLVQAPTLLIVGGADHPVIGLNHQALQQLGAAQKQLILIPGASHLFEEPGALDQVARLAAEWFRRYLRIGGENPARP
jgi:dienelactone hydrolase